MQNQSRKIKLITAVLTIALFFTACEQITNEAPTATPTQAPAGEWTGEPCLSPEAQEKLQFAPPVADEVVAEIIVKDYGSIFVRFFPEQAPKAVENFQTHAREGYYDNTTFHRVISDFMIQGGDPDGTGYGGASIYGEPFEDEIAEGLEPFRGALCMANAGADTNGSQFFLVQADTTFMQELSELVGYKNYNMLDYLKSGYNTILREETLADYMIYGGTPWLSGHHTVFGQMYDGFEVLDAITEVATDSKNYKPLEDVVVTTVRIFNYSE